MFEESIQNFEYNMKEYLLVGEIGKRLVYMVEKKMYGYGSHLGV